MVVSAQVRHVVSQLMQLTPESAVRVIPSGHVGASWHLSAEFRIVPAAQLVHYVAFWVHSAHPIQAAQIVGFSVSAVYPDGQLSRHVFK